MRPDVSGSPALLQRPGSLGRLAAIASVLALLGAACSSLPTGEVQTPRGREFLSTVPDSVDDVGFGNSITVDGEGLPVVSYLGFVAPIEEGEIPVARPVGSPFLTTAEGDDAGAVLLASLSTDQYWNRGAVAQPRETPGGVTVPFGPAEEPSLRSLTPRNAKGTDVAVAGEDIHVVWTADTGVWYGVGPGFEIGPVEKTPDAGAPSVVVDASGAPLVAYTTAGAEPDVQVAERVGERWRPTTVATLSACGADCPPATQVAMVGEEPLVVVADPRSGELIAAQRQGAAWSSEVVATGVTGGASLAAAGGTATIGFYTEAGVAVATGRFGDWSVDEVAPVRSLQAGGDDEAATPDPTTGVAAGDQGTTWVAWQDRDGIHLASRSDGAYEEVDVTHSEGGVAPSVAVSEDGASVYLSWFDPVEADLHVGIYAETGGVMVAAPSPTAAPGAPAPPTEGCEPSGTTLEVAAQGIAFDMNCLAAPAQQPFEIVFNNQDQAIPHNVAIYTDSSAEETLFEGETFSGVEERTYDVKALEAGDFFFRCDVHPDQMTGAFIVAEAGGGGGGNGGGGGGNGGGGDGGGGGGGNGGGGGEG
jgi:hypothetical protein